MGRLGGRSLEWKRRSRRGKRLGRQASETGRDWPSLEPFFATRFDEFGHTQPTPSNWLFAPRSAVEAPISRWLPCSNRLAAGYGGSLPRLSAKVRPMRPKCPETDLYRTLWTLWTMFCKAFQETASFLKEGCIKWQLLAPKLLFRSRSRR